MRASSSSGGGGGRLGRGEKTRVGRGRGGKRGVDPTDEIMYLFSELS